MVAWNMLKCVDFDEGGNHSTLRTPLVWLQPTYNDCRGGRPNIDDHYASLTTQGGSGLRISTIFFVSAMDSVAPVYYMHSLIPVKHQGMALVKVEPKKICKLNKLKH